MGPLLRVRKPVDHQSATQYISAVLPQLQGLMTFCTKQLRRGVFSIGTKQKLLKGLNSNAKSIIDFIHKAIPDGTGPNAVLAKAQLVYQGLNGLADVSTSEFKELPNELQIERSHFKIQTELYEKLLTIRRLAGSNPANCMFRLFQVATDLLPPGTRVHDTHGITTREMFGNLESKDPFYHSVLIFIREVYHHPETMGSRLGELQQSSAKCLQSISKPRGSPATRGPIYELLTNLMRIRRQGDLTSWNQAALCRLNDYLLASSWNDPAVVFYM